MRWLVIGFLLLIGGVGLLTYATKFPVYTDRDAPEKLSIQLENSPRETRFKEWYSQIKNYETPRKKLSDSGRGICAAGFGMLSAYGFCILYRRFSWMRKIWMLIFIWIVLWAMRIPFTFWYYTFRQQRFDYPTWGDSIAIPIFHESFVWIVGAILTSLILLILLFRRALPSTISWDNSSGWIRRAFIFCWMVVLGLSVFYGIPDGNEGAVIFPIIAFVVLLIVLSARSPQDLPA